MGAKIVNELGVLEITDEVLSILAGITAIECYGIVGMASKRATDGLVELLGRDNLSRGVRVHSQGDEIIIDIFIIVEYGISIAAVAKNVIDTVKYNVETITGLKVNKVNVTVEGVRV
ncbi:MAG: Asp23/Gls24 family envelope stress response protein [Clostridia bacterium]